MCFKRLVCLALIVSTLFTVPALAEDNGGYYVVPFNPANYTEEELAHMDDSGADGTVTFWQLPLWIKLEYIKHSLFTGLIFGIALFTIGKIITILSNRNRRNLYNYILKNPGCTSAEMSRNMGMNSGTVRYHIQTLVNEGKIVAEKMGKFMRLFKNSSTYSDREKVVASHLRNGTSMAMIRSIIECPGITNSELSDRIGVTRSCVHEHIDRLAADRIVLTKEDGRNKRYYVTDESLLIVQKLAPESSQMVGSQKVK